MKVRSSVGGPAHTKESEAVKTTTSSNCSATKDAGLAVSWWPIEGPIPYERNARVVPESAIAKVAASIAEYGWKVPLVVDAKGVVIAGHTRLLAAKQLGLASVPVIIASDLTPAQVKAFRIADNRSAQETTWDYELLPAELGELLELDYDLGLLGFDHSELAEILSQPTRGLCDPDFVPEPPAEPLSRRGDLWVLGRHRLLCGDATEAADVARLMAGKRASLMATDPPYLIDYDGGNHPQTWGKGGRKITPAEKTKHWDDYVDYETSVDFYHRFLEVALQAALTDSPLVYQFFAMMRAEVVFAAWRKAGLRLHQIVIWRKSRPVLSRCDFMYDFEPLAYGWAQGKRPEPARRPPANARAVWEIDQREGVEEGVGCVHPTIKPVEIVRRPIEFHTNSGELLYEPFSGSGTAIIAAEMSGRACYALELSPAYVDVAVARWEAFAGARAVRHG